MEFIQLEGAYIGIGIFILLITTFVTTRSFVNISFKLSFGIVLAIISIMIIAHYEVTSKRMFDVKAAFEKGETLLCESREIRNASQTVLVNKKVGWVLKNDVFISEQYERGFHTARCVVE